MIDEAFMQMGGFGRIQKISYVSNTLTQGAASFIVYCLVFLEKFPVFHCRLNVKDENGDIPDLHKYSWQECHREQFCDAEKRVIWRVDWDHPESLHNIIE
jgi:hypothetical protein